MGLCDEILISASTPHRPIFSISPRSTRDAMGAGPIMWTRANHQGGGGRHSRTAAQKSSLTIPRAAMEGIGSFAADEQTIPADFSFNYFDAIGFSRRVKQSIFRDAAERRKFCSRGRRGERKPPENPRNVFRRFKTHTTGTRHRGVGNWPFDVRSSSSCTDRQRRNQFGAGEKEPQRDLHLTEARREARRKQHRARNLNAMAADTVPRFRHDLEGAR